VFGSGYKGRNRKMKLRLVIILLVLVFLAGLFMGLAVPRTVDIDTLRALDYLYECRGTHQRVVDGKIPLTINTGSIEFNQMWVWRYTQIIKLLEDK